jgi:hypothetical protein
MRASASLNRGFAKLTRQKLNWFALQFGLKYTQDVGVTF